MDCNGFKAFCQSQVKSSAEFASIDERAFGDQTFFDFAKPGGEGLGWRFGNSSSF